MSADEADTPISDSQGVAGNPDSPGASELQDAGPDANPHRDQDTH